MTKVGHYKCLAFDVGDIALREPPGGRGGRAVRYRAIEQRPVHKQLNTYRHVFTDRVETTRAPTTDKPCRQTPPPPPRKQTHLLSPLLMNQHAGHIPKPLQVLCWSHRRYRTSPSGRRQPHHLSASYPPPHHLTFSLHPSWGGGLPEPNTVWTTPRAYDGTRRKARGNGARHCTELSAGMKLLSG